MSTLKKVDLRGLVCPEPVLRVKALFNDEKITRVEALVDDEVCVNNLKRLSRTLAASAFVEEKDGYFEIAIQRGGTVDGMPTVEPAHAHEAQLQNGVGTAAKTGTVIFLPKDTFGAGDPDFSRTLLNLFLQSALQADRVPDAILLANSGVKLLAPDSQALRVLQDFRSRGCEVLACGLCVEFYGLKEAIPKDQITNMYSIAEFLFAANKVLTF